MLNQTTTTLDPQAALDLLAHMGIPIPTLKQVEIITSILSTTLAKQQLVFDHRLTAKEQHFLVWIAHGKTIEETGDLLGIHVRDAYHYHNEIRRKLNCRTLSQAVFEGLRLGYITEKQTVQN